MILDCGKGVMLDTRLEWEKRVMQDSKVLKDSSTTIAWLPKFQKLGIFQKSLWKSNFRDTAAFGFGFDQAFDNRTVLTTNATKMQINWLNYIFATELIQTWGEGKAMLLPRVRWDGSLLLQLDQPSSLSLDLYLYIWILWFLAKQEKFSDLVAVFFQCF